MIAWTDDLLCASIQGGLTIGVLWVLLRLIRGVPPSVQVWLWRLAILKMFVALGAPIVVATQDSPPVGFGVVDTESSRLAVAIFAMSLGGVLLVAVQLCAQFRQAKRLRAASRPFSAVAIDETSQQLQMRSVPELLVSDDIDCPLVLGPWRPVIVLPRAVAEGDETDLRLVLAHELAHICRRDLLWGWLPQMAEAVFFFHPLVWLARIELRAAQETACDALAIHAVGASPTRYGKLLIRLAQGRSDLSLSAPLAAGVVGGYRSLKGRLTRLSPTTRRLHPLTLCTLTLLFFAMLPGWRFAPQGEPPEKSSGALAAPIRAQIRFAHEVPMAQKNSPQEGKQ
jgi:beta-lactamase regulating signal transducer with metallopeptidase domain